MPPRRRRTRAHQSGLRRTGAGPRRDRPRPMAIGIPRYAPELMRAWLALTMPGGGHNSAGFIQSVVLAIAEHDGVCPHGGPNGRLPIGFIRDWWSATRLARSTRVPVRQPLR